MLVLTEEQRDLLKKPFGTLIADPDVTAESIRREAGEYRTLVTVGDATTARFAELGVGAGIEIVDGKEKRSGRDPPQVRGGSGISCANAPGTISDGAVLAVRRAFRLPAPVRITVDGEEDLLVLAVCDACPEGTVVAYGQPGEGVVVVRVDATARDKARRIIGAMKRRDDETVAG